MALRSADDVGGAWSVEGEREQTARFRLNAFVLRRPLRAVFRLFTIGCEHVPHGTFVLAPKELSNIDGWALGIGIYRRQPRWMGKAELFDNPLTRPLARALGIFPVRRGEGDRAAIASAVGLARAGHVVGIFPDGTRRTKGFRIAVDALRSLPARVRPRRLVPSDEPLPGAGRPAPPPDGVDAGVWRYLVGLYGADTWRLAQHAAEDENALEPISPAGPDVWAQVRIAMEDEWAVTPEDVIWRRTTLGARGADATVREAVATHMATSPAPDLVPA